ncbi:MAG: PKD domain-containing protein [Gammaproteobacteria bacterium]|nr:MAG: PKD domain-containing protein [Gammaproteobacteria bacterium]
MLRNCFPRASGLALALALTLGMAMPPAHAIDSIPCETTPFGNTNLMLGDAEMLTLHDGTTPANTFAEYRQPRGSETDALVEVYASSLFPAGLPAGAYPLDASEVDLNGDGRDEIAVAYGAPPALGNIVIGVFQRTPGFTPSAQLIDTWSIDLNPEGTGMSTVSVELEAGDFSGTSGLEQQLALKWRSLQGPDDGHMNVIVLTGGSDGSINEPDNTWAGRWEQNGVHGESGLTHGDVLLDGRDQIIVVSGTGQHIYIYLLEFNAPGAHVNTGLPVAVGDTAIGSLEFPSSISPFVDDGFTSPSDPVNCPNASCNQTINVLSQSRLVANAGNLVDTAAEELLVSTVFRGNVELRTQNGTLVSSYLGDILGQRLLHFNVVRSAPGEDISAITLASSGPGRDFDASQVLGPRYDGQPNVTPGGFDLAIGNVFGAETEQIVLSDYKSETGGRQLRTQVFSASVRLQAGFTYDVLEATGPFPARFTTTATGDVASLHWNFGDGSSSVAQNPTHSYNATGLYTVTQTVTDSSGKQSSYSTQVQINGAVSSGGRAESYSYQLPHAAQYIATTSDQVEHPSPFITITTNNEFEITSPLRIQVRDMDRDGRAEIITNAQSVRRIRTQETSPLSDTTVFEATIWRSRWSLDTSQIPAVLTQAHALEVTDSSVFPNIEPDLPFGWSALVASDFDGDAVHATIGSQCGAVYEPQLRNLIWMPPFFSALQSGSLDNGYMSASFGNQQSSGSSTENRSGSTTGHSVSAYVGVQAGTSDTSPVRFEISLKATAGHDWQSAKGEIHGGESEQSYSEGQSASQGEALLIGEGNSAFCYTYDVIQSSGPVPDSAMRMCEMAFTERNAQTAELWNAQFVYGQTVPNWMPVQRDWASQALFIAPTSTIPFQSGREADKATDGLFSTAATSVSTTNPYLDIDLGSVQPIEVIRIFPAANVDADNGTLVKPLAFTLAALDLQGFHVYVSATPFDGAQVPSGAGVYEFAPPTDSGLVYDRWNIMARDSNFNPLQVRYIRLQHPEQISALINVSEIQVFATTHSEPPAYPQAVCQPATGTGYFLARVWNTHAGGYRNIEERGEMMWAGTNEAGAPTGVLLGNGDACINHAGIRQTTIWNNLRIGNPGITHSWDSTSNTSQTVGSYGSFESTTRVGAEVEMELGNKWVQAIAGLSYEYSFGLTRDKQSVSFWGNGLQIGGSVGGFDNEHQSLVMPCGYFPHPYAYRLTDRGSLNYAHDLYVVDYIVQQPDNGSSWQRGSVPLECYGQDDTIFAHDFDN